MREERPPREEERGKRRRRRGRLSLFEKIIMGIGYASIVYWLARGAVYVAVLLAP